MSESVRSSSDPNAWSASNGYKGTSAENASTSYESTDRNPGEAGKTLVIGLLGGLVSAAGYMIYQRLPDEQKDRLHGQVKGMLAQRINEIRQNFNI